MSDLRKVTGAPQRRADAELAADLEALRRESERDPVSLATVLRSASRPPRTAEERLMALFGPLSRRRWIPAAFAGALAALALLVVPVSYQKTTGHRVTLALAGRAATPDRLRAIATQLKSVLHADGVAVEADMQGGAPAYTLAATSPAAAHVDAAKAAQAFRARLAALGWTASASVTPVRERVTGSMVAYAMDRIVRIDVGGKSAAQLEDEIRRALADAGVENPQVSVEKTTAEGKDQLRLSVEAKKTSTDANAPATPVEIVLQKDGAPLGGEAYGVRQELRRAPDGATMTMHVESGAKRATVTVEHYDTLGEAAILASVRSQLAAAGIDADVTMENGRVQVQLRH